MEESIPVAPLLQPFHFEEKLQAGDRAGVTCLVTKGDPPISFTWQKDGRPIQEVEGVSVSSMNHFSSALMVSRLTALHTGEYTCKAANHWAKATHSAALAVNVPPAWVVEPASASVALGGTVALHCLAKGFPNPSVAWRKETTSGEFVGVSTGEGGVVGWGNGTLLVSRAERRHEGRYLCEASNGVGAGLSKVVTLSVNEPPWFGVRSQRQQVVVGGAATLTCEAHGDAPLTLAWTRGVTPLPPSTRYEMSERQLDSGRVSELVIRSAHITDSGTYVCTATNTHGSLTADFHLLVQDVPGPPSGVTVVEEGSRHMTLTWTSPEDSNAPISAYLVTFDAHQSPMLGGPREVTVEGDQRRVRLDDLLPAMTYTLTVVAENRVGRSEASNPLRVTTQEEPPSGHPQNVAVVAVSSSTLQVTWEPPLDNLTHGTILGYYLGFKDDSEGESGAYNFTTVGVDAVGVTRATLAGLRPYAQYSVVLQAFNSRGAGPASPQTSATTHQDKPGAPPGHVTCESVTSSSLLVTWSPPPPRHRNGVIISYRVAFSQVSSHEGGRSGSVVSEGLQATLAGLTPWTNYSISVAASTRAGEGVPSHILSCTTDQDVPEAPARIKAVISGPRAAVLSWAPPTRPHGRISRYTVHWEIVGGRDGPMSRRVEPHVTHLTLHDLSHATHQVWVTASTRMGAGPPSTVAVVKPSHTVGAGVWSVGGNLTVAWKEDVSLACGAVGVPEPILSWTHRRKHIPANHNRVKVQPDGTLTLADTQRSDSGSYTCTATNHHGSDTVTYNLTVLVPPSSPSLHVTETTGSSIRVQWSVEDTGGAALQGATLHYRSAGEEWLTVTVDGDRSAYTATGLRCGTLHHFYLTAHNHIGSSSASRTEAARTKGRSPEAPPKFQFVTTNSSQATLYLAQWGDGGCPITHYSVQYRRATVRHWTTVGSEIPPTRTYAVGGLEGGSRYELRVTAHNAAGATPAHYGITTPGQGNTGGAGEGVGGGMWGSAPSTSPAWRDPRVLVPASVSAVALLLTLTTVCVCVRRRPSSASPVQKEVPDAVTTTSDEPTMMQARDDVYITVRRAAPTPPQQQQQDVRDNSGEYSEEELYPYATATFQMGGGSPPPPAPPSPPTHAAHHQQPRAQKGFTALVYQAPSLHDVDSPNISDVEGRGTPRAFAYDGSQAEDYSGVLSTASGDARSPSHYRRPQRHLRTSRASRNVHFT